MTGELHKCAVCGEMHESRDDLQEVLERLRADPPDWFDEKKIHFTCAKCEMKFTEDQLKELIMKRKADA